MSGAVITGSFVMCAVGACYVLENRFAEYGRILRVGVVVGLISCITQIFPTGDLHRRYMAKHQPAAVAGMEGLFNTQRGAGIVLIGRPNEEKQTIDNPLFVNNVPSFLIYGTTEAEVKGLDQVPRDQWPEPLPLLFYSYRIMAGLGTYFALLMVVAAFLLWRGKLFVTRWALWFLMLSFPLPYIANTAGWMTAEIGRQPWVVYGLIRTSDGYSKYVSAGNGLFTLLASIARRFATADRRLAMSEVARKLNKATQFCGSAIVNVPTGGKKKKLNRRVARTEANAASRNPHALAMTSTRSRYAKPTVVALTGIRRYAPNVTIATPAKDTTTRNERRPKGAPSLPPLF